MVFLLSVPCAPFLCFVHKLQDSISENLRRAHASSISLFLNQEHEFTLLRSV